MIHKVIGPNLGNSQFLCNKQKLFYKGDNTYYTNKSKELGHRKWDKVTCIRCLKIYNKLSIVIQYNYQKYY